MRVLQVDRKGVCASGVLFLCLQRIHGPVRRMVELRLVEHVVLARQLVDHTGGCCVLHQQPGPGQRIRRPYAAENAAAPVLYP